MIIGNWDTEHPLALHRCITIADNISFIHEYEQRHGTKLVRERDEVKRMFFPFTCDMPGDRRIDAAKYSEKHHKYTNKSLRTILDSKTSHRYSIKGLRHEHVVPRSIILDIMLEDSWCQKGNVHAVQKILSKYLKVAIVTREEDLMLSKNGLMYGMPKGWNKEDIYARYETAGITLNEQQE